MTGQPRQAGPSRAALANAQLGINQILWANDDLPELNPPIDALGGETLAAGRILAFHHHGGTYVETPDELEQLMAATDPEVVGICLDTGHYLMGGGEPVTALRRYGERVRHVHLKDIDPGVLARMQ